MLPPSELSVALCVRVQRNWHEKKGAKACRFSAQAQECIYVLPREFPGGVEGEWGDLGGFVLEFRRRFVRKIWHLGGCVVVGGTV